MTATQPNDADGDATRDTPDTGGRAVDEPSMEAGARVRADVYGVLAATFDGDVETLATALDDGVFTDLAAALPVDVETEPLETAPRDPETLKIGYDNLFVVPGPHYVPPFASGHATDPSESFDSDSPYHDAGRAGELLGDPAAEMARLYAAASFEPDRGDGLPDHLAAAFEFMRALCAREAVLLGGDCGDDGELEAVRDAQRAALSRFDWLDAFDEAVARADDVEGVFATLARVARCFAAWDAREGAAVE